MDQLTAHLDRGWDLAQSGDLRGAEASARTAIELAPEAPEPYNLLGYVASLDGETEEALEAYQHAIALDEGYVEAMLSAAELLVHPLGEFEDALAMCERILDLSDFDDERVDALLLQFEAHWALEQDEEATRVLKRLPAGPFESAAHNFLAGRAHFELGDHARARSLIEAALAADPGHPEATYYAGMLAEAAGDRSRANALFLRVRQLESDEGLPSWAPNEEAFLRFVEQAVDGLPAPLRERMQGAEVFVVDLPGPEMIVDGVDVHAQVLIDAIGALPGSAPPAEARLRVFLYAVNLLRTAGSLHAVQATVGAGLERELTQLIADLAARTPAS